MCKYINSWVVFKYDWTQISLTRIFVSDSVANENKVVLYTSRFENTGFSHKENNTDGKNVRIHTNKFTRI